jgi:hypothetical protein
MRLERQDPMTKSILGGCGIVLGLGVAAYTTIVGACDAVTLPTAGNSACR